MNHKSDVSKQYIHKAGRHVPQGGELKQVTSCQEAIVRTQSLSCFVPFPPSYEAFKMPVPASFQAVT